MASSAVDDSKSNEIMTPENIIAYLTKNSNKALIDVLGSPPYKAKECGDGNINFIFIVQGRNGSVVVKQAPPFVRLVGPDWSLKQNRLNFEVAYMQKTIKHSPEHAPKIYLVDNDAFLFAMEDLNTSKMKVFRTQIANGIAYPNVGKHVGTMLANMLFKTSDLSLKAETKWNELSYFCGNNEMISLTEQVIFEEPFCDAKQNRFDAKEYNALCPQMCETVKKLRSNNSVIRAVLDLRRKFRNLHQTLVHGDLHTGSIMVCETRTVVIDAEFSMYGPFFVDIGLFCGNLFLAMFAQKLYPKRNEFVKYLCEQTIIFYKTFCANFLKLWRNSDGNAGNLIPTSIGNAEMRSEYELEFMNDIWTNSVKFAGVILIRRTLGIADASEFRIDKSRNDERFAAEEKACRFGMDILSGKVNIDSIETVVDELQKYL